jgi:(p)ppGpp synthase/HD superfamily hydrolase
MKNLIVEKMSEKDHADFEARQEHPETQDVLTKAKFFATVSHGGQMRKDKKTPYIVHPERVVKTLEDIGVGDREILAAAYLHDVLEDTKSKIDEFPERVKKIVSELTNTLSDKNNYISSFGNKSKEAILIKLADRYDNLTDGSKTMGEPWLKKYLDSTKLLLKSTEKIKTWNLGYKMHKKLSSLQAQLSASFSQ